MNALRFRVIRCVSVAARIPVETVIPVADVAVAEEKELVVCRRAFIPVDVGVVDQRRLGDPVLFGFGERRIVKIVVQPLPYGAFGVVVGIRRLFGSLPVIAALFIKRIVEGLRIDDAFAQHKSRFRVQHDPPERLVPEIIGRLGCLVPVCNLVPRTAQGPVNVVRTVVLDQDRAVFDPVKHHVGVLHPVAGLHLRVVDRARAAVIAVAYPALWLLFQSGERVLVRDAVLRIPAEHDFVSGLAFDRDGFILILIDNFAAKAERGPHAVQVV